MVSEWQRRQASSEESNESGESCEGGERLANVLPPLAGEVPPHWRSALSNDLQAYTGLDLSKESHRLRLACALIGETG